MTAEPTEFAPFPIHFLGPVTLVADADSGRGRVFAYGHELRMTPEIVALNTDRNGECRLAELIDDEAGQVNAWGAVRVRRGPWPEGVSRLEPGSYEWELAREAARQEAWKLADETKRSTAVADVVAQFGAAPRTSKTVRTSR